MTTRDYLHIVSLGVTLVIFASGIAAGGTVLGWLIVIATLVVLLADGATWYYGRQRGA